jgi:hypothetical protein
MIVTKFKVPASVVFLDIDGEFVPFGWVVWVQE